jgi:hypothetical protein
MDLYVDALGIDWMLINWPDGRRTYVTGDYRKFSRYLQRVDHPPDTGFQMLCPLRAVPSPAT